MKWIPVCIMVLALSACGGAGQPSYYQLPQADAVLSSQLHKDATGRPAVWIERLTLPDYLSAGGIVYQTSKVNYVIASRHLWASPLDQQLKQALINNLSAQLPGRVVSATALGDRPDVLSVNITAFQGRYDGQVVISGDWILQQGNIIRRQGFSLSLPLRDDGYQPLVKTLAAGWQQVSAEIARQLSSAAGNR
ncbi:hypothetical protein BL250_01230 [Erwinia sp. OLTSP20]|nr:hypothetical protein BV501_04765 [Erwinia sp. OAMSP11]PIJ74134.1 hypothetical protein BK416_05055 [Erwinia sp. OLSSP12]PIJ81576.1 hypothetical protein BLD47_08590 [Erwinia sp. OLCASP19]PIJ86097.1 hypothetical protein BLD46_04850 [Erwinia sp. OLMTSP26]PIJ87883.1 hypothetical protein BLD49_04850 [Erwinia sp. OLMDSP33]PIJ90915.1 hypothetical protein BL249_11270 [Erwinia sp. OLFS4]PIJ95261.1 hypothetical protein BL250_01230 [Erwinia sp. OLTSP20]